MKKLTTIVIAILYLSFSSGVTINLHYCMGEYVSFSFFNGGNTSCGKCGMEKHDADNNCCSDIKETAKISDAHKTPVNEGCFLYNAPFIISTDRILMNTSLSKGEPTLQFHQDYISPPGIVPHYIEFRNLRI